MDRWAENISKGFFLTMLGSGAVQFFIQPSSAYWAAAVMVTGAIGLLTIFIVKMKNKKGRK